ncbi:hypothetical protein RFF05_06620 [Bengtsoniella intestinalis]|uniref:hypothetical protein n=1 Tax=Bengtsoniella intestinalis TaxID=3073143 RepID=UPI00391EEB89
MENTNENSVNPKVTEDYRGDVTIKIPLSLFEELIKARTERDVVKKLVYSLPSYQSGDTIKQVFDAVSGKAIQDKE